MTVSTHIVKRQSGYVAGWFTQAQADSGEAAAFAAECNLTVPADPAELIELDPDGTAWDGLLGTDEADPDCRFCFILGSLGPCDKHAGGAR